MRRALTALSLTAILAGCSHSNNDASTITPLERAEIDAAWLDQFDYKAPIYTIIEDQSAVIDAGTGNLYVADCDIAQRATSEGAPFGPSPRQPDGSYTPGLGYVCHRK